MKRIYIALCILALAFPLSAATVTVYGSANIYAAGQASPPYSPGPFWGTPGYGGTLPTLYMLIAGQPVLHFTSVTGLVGCCSDKPQNGPDGGTDFSTDINSLAGISGIIAPTDMFLAGVFLTDAPPSDVAPERLNFTVLGTDFSSISPELSQVFFIGDGRRSGGTTLQDFVVPSGATRLYLGFVDGVGFVANPGAYGDNTGYLTVGINNDQAPEPASMLLVFSGALALFVGRKFCKSTWD